MSYPPVRYTAADGEPSAYVHRAGGEADLLLGSTKVSYLATGATTGGAYGLYRWEMAGPGGPAPHFHRTMTESFYVLTGQVQLHDGRGWTDASPGDFLHVPPGGVHGFRNASGQPASMLLLFTPGAPREGYFEELAELVRTGRQLSREEWAELYARHDQVMVG